MSAARSASTRRARDRSRSRGSRASVSGTPESPPRVRTVVPAHAVSTGSRQRGCRRRDPRASTGRRARPSARAAPRRACPRRASADPSAAISSSAAARPGCTSRSPSPSRCPRGANRRSPSRIVSTGASISRQVACAGGIATPSRASRIAGSSSRGQSRRPCGARARRAPPEHPVRRRRRANRVVDELLAEGHLQLHELGIARRRAETRHRREEVELLRARPAAASKASRARRREDLSSPPRRRRRRSGGDGRVGGRRRPPRGSRGRRRRWRGDRRRRPARRVSVRALPLVEHRRSAASRGTPAPPARAWRPTRRARSEQEPCAIPTPLGDPPTPDVGCERFPTAAGIGRRKSEEAHGPDEGSKARGHQEARPAKRVGHRLGPQVQIATARTQRINELTDICAPTRTTTTRGAGS